MDAVAEAGLLAVQEWRGLAFHPWTAVALLRDEFEGRVTVVMADGSVAHRPGPATPGPGMIPIADGVVGNPRHATRDGPTLLFPGGWRYPHHGPLPKPPAIPKLPNPILPGGRLHASDIILIRDADGQAACTTLKGDVTLAASPAEVARAHGHLIRFTHGWLNLRRLRRIEAVATGYRVILDGAELSLTRWAGQGLARALGLPALDWLRPASARHRAMYRLGLRDFPFRLLDAPADTLRALFGVDETCVIANLI